MMKKKNRKIIILLFVVGCITLWTQAMCSFAAESTTEPKGVILSWSENPASTQSITWSDSTQGKGRIQFVAAKIGVNTPDFSKAKKIQAKCIEVAPKVLYRYEVVIRNLTADTIYWYRVSNGTVWSNPSTFRTAPVSVPSYRFMYLGDVQFEIREEDYQSWSDMISKAYADHPDIRFCLMGGDYVNSSGNTKDWNCFLKAAQPVFSKIPMMTVPGNHETSILPFYYLKNFCLPLNGPQNALEEFYSFDYGDCHFVELNSCIFMPERKNYLGEDAWDKLTDEVNQWLKNDLKSSSAKWEIVTMHHPAYGVAEDDAIYQLIRDNWAPIFTEAKVDLVFCGHQHVTMRTEKIGGVTYFMGNSGAKKSYYYETSQKPDYLQFIDDKESTYQIVDVSMDQLSLLTYNKDNKLLDQIAFIK